MNSKKKEMKLKSFTFGKN